MADYKQIQERLNALGAKPPLTVDGAYGPKTRAAIIAFQQAKGLVADGIVGPKTMAALGIAGAAPVASSGGSSLMGNVSPATASAYQRAYEISKRADPNMPEPLRQYALTVGASEGGFGAGWAHPSAATIAKSQKYGLTGYEGKDSNNWGATQGQGDAGSFPHIDSGWMIPDENGKPTSKHWQGKGPKVWGDYVANYRKWSTPEKGFLDVAKIILGGGKRGTVGAQAIKAALEKGNLREAVFAQHANGYFELDPNQYLVAVVRNYDKLSSSIGWKKLLGENGVTAVASGVGLFIAGALGVIGYSWWKSRA